MGRIKTHPGAILRGELETLGLSAGRLAIALGVPANRITEIIKEQRGITPDTAIRLAAYFGGSPRWWVGMQTQHDLSKLEAERGEAIRSEVRPVATHAEM
ncbi:MAG: HigA family addiction module antitoxin [Thermodesulfobacteriota bacterium]